MNTAGILKALESFLFTRRALILGVFVVFTLAMGFFGQQLRMEAGYEKQMPAGHEYIKTFQRYRDDLFGANRLTIVVKARHGTIWTREALTRLNDVTQAVFFLPNVDRLGVQSLWTPNTFVNETTVEGFKADALIGGTVTPATLTPEIIHSIQLSTSKGGYIGELVSRDQTSAMVTAEISEVGADGKKLDYVAYNSLLNEKICNAFEDDKFEIQIIGFAKQIGDIIEGASSVLKFCGIALLLTTLAVYWYCRSVRLTILPIACSLTSLVWQFGTLHLMGYGLDPLAVLVPFLVFSIGVSHGVQQINFIVREIANGKSSNEAARLSFSGLLIPGTLALVTAFVSFITLLLVPIPMVKELAVISSIGVGYKIFTNLVMLPVAASYFNFSTDFAAKAMISRDQRARWLQRLSLVAEPRNAIIVTGIAMAVLGIAALESRDRVVGTLQPGAPELRADSRFNRDAVAIANSYNMGLDWLSVVFEAPKDSCNNVAVGKYEDDFNWVMAPVPGVLAISSFADQMRTYSQGFNESNPKMNVVPIDPANYGAIAAEIARNRGYVNSDCSMTATHLYLTDHKAKTINNAIEKIKKFREENKLAGVTIRLAGGNVGVIAAVNDEVQKSELPMMLYVYGAIAILVLLAYRDFRAVLACCLPLTIATFVGYWFMKVEEIGLTVATLPVMVLAVGIGVDYAFYIYNRLQLHLAKNEGIVYALEHSIREVGMATIFTAITLSIGVATWSFSALKFQADMGKLLAFMFMVNLIMAMTVLPALAVVLERILPRRGPVRTPGFLQH